LFIRPCFSIGLDKVELNPLLQIKGSFLSVLLQICKALKSTVGWGGRDRIFRKLELYYLKWILLYQLDFFCNSFILSF